MKPDSRASHCHDRQHDPDVHQQPHCCQISTEASSRAFGSRSGLQRAETWQPPLCHRLNQSSVALPRTDIFKAQKSRQSLIMTCVPIATKFVDIVRAIVTHVGLEKIANLCVVVPGAKPRKGARKAGWTRRVRADSGS